MSTRHVVAQGEHLSGIASHYAFTDYHQIWDHPQNAELKNKRQNPNVLFPGDVLVIPDKELRVELRPTDQRHSFVLMTRSLKLRLKLDRTYNVPIHDAPCKLLVQAQRFDLTTDGSGGVEHDISKTAVQALLVVQDSITYKGRTTPVQVEIPLKIGYLDPVEELSGQVARLANLGYYRASTGEIDQDEFLSAVEEFQLEYGLVVDGKCGPKTQAKLKEAHGC